MQDSHRDPVSFDDPAAWTASNAAAVAIRCGGDLLLTARRPVAAFAELKAVERRGVFDLLCALEVPEGTVRFDLRASEGGRWHIRVSPAPAAFAGLPDFIGGEEEHLLPALQRGLRAAETAELLAAFVKPAGVDLLRDDLEDALLRGAKVRMLTGDYLGISDPAALRRLCELGEEHPTFEAAIYRCDDQGSFHAKAYIFAAGEEATAYVGSSNLSAQALGGGVEWNLRTLRGGDSGEIRAIRARFDRLWRAPNTARLSHAWIDDYAARRPASAVSWEPPPRRPTPHPIQEAALAALAAARDGGAARGLVVLATGLGKTLLAAFDAVQLGARRVLFLAHREEILVQARRAFARVLPEASSGLFDGKRRERGAALIFASVQTLARREHLATWPAEHFDLIVVDEFHHAAAATYRRILDHFAPRFLLGVTATPERSDGGELLALCDDNLVFRAGIKEGIDAGRLVPFAYHGVRDAVDYEAIPWRSGRFDAEALSAALVTRAHAEAILGHYRERAPAGPRRGLWFCASIQHAEFMAAALSSAGIAAVAVHSGPGGAPRSESLRRLAAGDLEAITTVDVFNEGVDVPDVNVVVLLRPTESRVVFLQQIGRGLRLGERAPKPRLVILDVVGNHRSFLKKPQALLGLLGREVSGRAAARALRSREYVLPEGCSVDFELEAIELLDRMSGDDGGDLVASIFAQLRDERGRRPRLAELADAGAQARGAARVFGSWWDLVEREGELSEDEARVLGSRREALLALETARATDVALWEALRAWIAAGGVDAPIEDDALPALAEGASTVAALAKLWPAGLALNGGALGLRESASDEDVPVLEDMIDEIAEARLHELRRRRPDADDDGFALQVKRSSSGPILRFKRAPGVPRGWTEVSVLGELFDLNFVDIAVNVARRGDATTGVLQQLLRRIFGADAGANGTDHRVLLREIDGRWTLIPLGDRLAEVVTLPFYPELAVACGVGDVSHDATEEPSTIEVRTTRAVDPRRHFVVRARGDSMKGGARPIADGDLVLCERIAAASPADVADRACLLVAAAGPGASEAMIKVPVKEDEGWRLRSWSKRQEDLPIDRWEAITVVARVIEVVPPA